MIFFFCQILNAEMKCCFHLNDEEMFLLDLHNISMDIFKEKITLIEKRFPWVTNALIFNYLFHANNSHTIYFSISTDSNII